MIRLRGLELRAAEIVMGCLTFRWLENRTFTDRLWWLAKHHAGFAETIEPADVSRVVFLRNLWLDICGLHMADGERTENGVRILSVKGEPLFATPFESREIALQALQPDGSEFAIEAARQGRQRAAFICRTFATILDERKPSAAIVVRPFSEWQTKLLWSPTTWARRRKDFAPCFTDVPGENACSIREPELSLWLASAENKNRSPFETS